MEGFKKLSEVQIIDEVAEDASVLVEDSGEVKRVPKSKIGAQADWNETDENSSAFILNKPTQLGGSVSKFFHIYDTNCIVYVRDNETWLNEGYITYNIPDDVVDYHEFEDAFMNSLCLINTLSDDNYNYKQINVATYFAPYNSEYKYGLTRYSGSNIYIRFRGYYE